METITTASNHLVWKVSMDDTPEISRSSTYCQCVGTIESGPQIVEQGYSGYDLAGNILISLALGVAFGFWLGMRWVRKQAIARNLAEYDIDTDDGRVKFWWIGKAGKK